MIRIPVTKLVREIESRLEQKANPERREVASWYFPSAMTPIGVATPDIRAVTRDVSRRIEDAGADEVLRLTHALIARNKFEVRTAAYSMLARHRLAMATLRVREVERLGRGNDNWASVDHFGCSISGPAWRAGHVSDAAVRRWTRSRDRWWRRTALVSTVALNLRSRGGHGDVPRTIDVCERLADDPDDMVVKGLSWALRSLIEVDRVEVARFLDAHDDVLARRVMREVGNKLDTGLKSGRRGAKPRARAKGGKRR